MTREPGAPRRPTFALIVLVAVLAFGSHPAGAGFPPPDDPFVGFDLPDDWEARFWASPNARALFKLSPKQAAALVPTQAGVRHCRCPACEAGEAENSLGWSLEFPNRLKCRACGVTVPNDKFPAPVEKEKDKKAVPEDTIEVLPGVVHHYPYHEVDPEHQHYPGERLYLAAKADYECREFLAKAALYASVRYSEQAAGHKDQSLARTAAVLLLRFAQVYPAYATHFDQPLSPKFFEKADLAPPYRSGYGTAKWDWSGSLDVPLNLVVAYALLRDNPALAEAGRTLGVADPARVVERDLFLASAGFTARQPEEFSEASLQADRGLLAVGRLLGEESLVLDARSRLDRFAERGFYHDGLWRQGGLAAHRRVIGQLDGWIGLLLSRRDGRGTRLPPSPALPMLTLARAAGSAPITDPPAPELLRAGWPAPEPDHAAAGPVLLGGAGLARLAVGRGADALDLELRSLDAFGPERIQRQALRLGVGGRPVLDDLDEHPGLTSGFDRATVSRNTVVVDGLNQRESLEKAGEPSPGGNFLFFAADPDFQAVTLDDRNAYPQSTRRYRQTLVASAGRETRYALAVFEVVGGLQHDQVFHGPVATRGSWGLSVPVARGASTLLSPGLTFVPGLPAEGGRWFIQAAGEFVPKTQATLTAPAQAGWTDADGARGGVNLHTLGDTPATVVTATSPDPTAPPTIAGRLADDGPGRASLVVRRRSADGSTLKSTFVTVFEPVTSSVRALKRVGRVASPEGTVVVLVESTEGAEQVVVNLAPGTARTVTLADGRPLTTDGLAVRVSASGVVLAGGTFAEVPGRRVHQEAARGRITGVVRRAQGPSRGWFETDAVLTAPETLAGRVVIVRHGDGTTRGWTLDRVENSPTGARLHVREEPGFELDPTSRRARYYQFPRTTFAGPHQFRIGQIARGRPGG